MFFNSLIRPQGAARAGAVVAAAILACAPISASAQPENFTQDADAFIAEAMARLPELPGVAVAIADAEGPIYLRGFGFADVEAGDPVTEDTAFYVASLTKSFTALAANILHHRGDLDLDATLAQAYPAGSFPQDLPTDEIRLRDLLTHTAGLDNNPIAFRLAFSGEHDTDLLWRLLGATTLRDDAPPGTFAYTNVGYNILALLMEQRTGKPWQEIIRDEILSPAGMTRTSSYISKAGREGWSLARPYAGIEPGGPLRLALEKQDNTMQSAGGTIISAADAAKWITLHLSNGQLGGERIIPAEIVAGTHAPLAETGSRFSSFDRDYYGLGWHIGRYGDDTLIHHFGSFAGARSHLSFMPERNVGVAVFVNDSTLGFFYADILAVWIYDRLAGKTGGAADSDAVLADLEARRDGMKASLLKGRAERAGRQFMLTRPESAYAGIYENDLYGTVEVENDAAGLTVRNGNLMSLAEPYPRQDALRVEMVPGRGETIRFSFSDGQTAPVLTWRGRDFIPTGG